MIAASVEIRPDAVAQILRFSDVDDLPGSIPMNVDAGIGRQSFEFLGDRHLYDSNLRGVEFAISVLAFQPFAFLASLRETSNVQTVLTSDVSEAAEFIRRGGIVAFPTETVYGLGADVFNAIAVAKIFEAKRRPSDNPLIAHVASLDQIAELTVEIPSLAHLFIESFFPGPLTLVLRKSDRVPDIATAGLDSIGVRMPRYDMARRFIEACGAPVVAPSANLSGRPSPTTWQAVLEDLDGRVDCILQGDPTEIGLESTVLDCTAEVPMLLRQGAISLAELQGVLPATIAYKQVDHQSPRSPGLKHRHYSPAATVIVITDLKVGIPAPRSTAFIGIGKPEHSFDLVKTCSSVEEYAHSIFEFFRECDRVGIRTIYCGSVPEIGIGAALMDRLRRAEAG